MTPKEYELAVRRSWAEDHFQQYGLSDEEIMAFLPLPSDDFTEGFRAGEKYARLNQWVNVDERLPEPDVEPEINTFKDLRKSGKYNRYLLCNDRYQEIALECMNPYERKMFATGIIAQLKEYYGGMVPFPQPIGCAKIVLCPDAEKFEVDKYRDWDALMTFHNIEQAERFLKYNERLVRDYYMLPRKEESC